MMKHFLYWLAECAAGSRGDYDTAWHYRRLRDDLKKKAR